MDRRRLPTYARSAFNTLRRTVAASNNDHNGLTTQQARTVLADEEELSKAGVENVLEILHNHGEIYYVGEEVRVTEMELSNADVRSNSE